MAKLFLIAICLLLSTNFVMLPIYGLTFRKVWRGTRFKLVLQILGFMMGANIAFFVSGIGQFGMLVCIWHEDWANMFNPWTLICAIGYGIGDLCFSEAHWLLAFFYFKMAKNMPRVHNNDE